LQKRGDLSMGKYGLGNRGVGRKKGEGLDIQLDWKGEKRTEGARNIWKINSPKNSWGYENNERGVPRVPGETSGSGCKKRGQKNKTGKRCWEVRGKAAGELFVKGERITGSNRRNALRKETN